MYKAQSQYVSSCKSLSRHHRLSCTKLLCQWTCCSLTFQASCHLCMVHVAVHRPCWIAYKTIWFPCLVQMRLELVSKIIFEIQIQRLISNSNAIFVKTKEWNKYFSLSQSTSVCEVAFFLKWRKLVFEWDSSDWLKPYVIYSQRLFNNI